MHRRFVKLEFANFRLHTLSRYDDIYHAVKHAQKNLWRRHGIFLSDPFVEKDGIFVCVKFPDEAVKGDNSDENIGRRLKGISNYLVELKPYKYSRVGNRLLNYYDVTDLYDWDRLYPN